MVPVPYCTVLVMLHRISKNTEYRYVMAEIPQFVYYLTITPQNSTPAKNTPEV